MKVNVYSCYVAVCLPVCKSMSTIIYLGQNKDLHSLIQGNSCWSMPMLSKESQVLLIAFLLIADSPHCYGYIRLIIELAIICKCLPPGIGNGQWAWKSIDPLI